MEVAVEEKAGRKYKPDFETEFEWVSKDPSGKELAYCTTCETTITPVLSCLKTHSTSWRHQKNNYDVKTTGKKEPLKAGEVRRGTTWKKDYELSRKFKDEWLVQFPWVKKKNERVGHCPFCVIDLEPRARRLEDHQNTSKHQKNYTSAIANSKQTKSSSEGEGLQTKPTKPGDFDKNRGYSQLMEDLPSMIDGTNEAKSDQKRISLRNRKKKLMFDEIEQGPAKNRRLRHVAHGLNTEYVADIIQAKPNVWSEEFPWVVLDEEEEKFPYCPFCGEFVEPTVSSLRRHQELIKHRKKSRLQILVDTTDLSDKDPEVLEETEVTDDSAEIHTTVVVPAGTVIQSGLGIDGMNQASFFPISGSSDQFLQIIIHNEASDDNQNVTELGNSIEVSDAINLASEENTELPSSIQITTYDGRTEEIFENDVIEYVSTEDNITKPFKKRKGQHGRGVRLLKPIKVPREESEEDRPPENEPIEEEGPPKKRFTRRSIRLRKPAFWREDDDDDDDDNDDNGKFLQEWLTEYPWARKKVENDLDIVYCTFCSINIPPKAIRLRLHDQTSKHKKNVEAAAALKIKLSAEKLQAPKTSDKPSSSGKVEAKPRYECDLCNRRFVAQRSLYFHMKEHYEPGTNHVDHEDTPAVVHVEETNNEEVETESPQTIDYEYNPKWAKIFPWLTKAEDNDWAFCVLCSAPMEPRLHVIKAHMKHRRHMRSVSKQPNPAVYETKGDVEGILAAEERRLSKRKKTAAVTLGETIIGEDGKARTKCPTCKKILVRTSFAVHWRIHEGVRPYKCTQCEWAFKQAYDLKHHVESIHNGARPHQCEECGKEFTRKYTLRLHQKCHSGNRSHKCDVCQKAFITNSKLVEHYRTHTGERPFLCDYCGRSFRIKFDMVTHKQKAHLGIEIPKRRNPRPPPAAVSNADSEVVVEESLALETHYVQLKEGDDVPLDLNADDSIVVVGDGQEVHGFDAFGEVIEEEEEEEEEEKDGLVYINEDGCFLNEQSRSFSA